MLFFDSDGNEWVPGTPGISVAPKKPKVHILPIESESMYMPSDPQKDLTLSTCIECGAPIPGGFISIALFDSLFEICLTGRCCLRPFSFVYYSIATEPLITSRASIHDRLLSGILQEYPGCPVCDRKNCSDPNCQEIIEQGILEPSDNEKITGHFYRIKLDLLSPIEAKCACKGQGIQTRCKICKISFCRGRCKRRHQCEGGVERVYA
jgi:hypothetical protein